MYLDKDVKSSRISESLLFDKSLVNVFGLKKVKTTVSKKNTKTTNFIPNKKNYTKGGKYGKVKGFDFYVQPNEKLKPFQRRELLTKSEDFISRIINEETMNGIKLDSIDKNIQHLDSNNKDSELIEIWNNFYDKYGCRLPQFKDKWERENNGCDKRYWR